MKTHEQILKESFDRNILGKYGDWVSFGDAKGANSYDWVFEAMEEYALQKIEQTVALYEIDRVNLVAMTLERDEFDEVNKNLSAELKSYKQWLKEREESMKRMEDEIKVLETKIQFLEPYKELYEEYKARYEFEENPPEIEEIFVTSSCPEDVCAAFIDKERAQWDAKESGTEVCSIKLHRGPKAI